jgi:tRNA1Val (adenine37-N6)-methyltransferase
MPNPYFQFKQFRVSQDQCAMKVCTDSCVLGAYANVSQATQILDIGTGTGLLALMLAQRTDAPIDAVEIDEVAARQAAENVARSPWPAQITVIQNSILEFAKSTSTRYDCIVCNPPFFSNHLKRKEAAQNVAMHGDSLQLPDLAQVAGELLQPDGKFITLLPPYENNLLAEQCLTHGLHAVEELHLFDYIGGKQIRTITGFAFAKDTILQTVNLYIKTAANGPYTDAFVELLKPYYLYL